MATATATSKAASRKAQEADATQEQQPDDNRTPEEIEQSERDAKLAEQHEEALEILEPLAEPRRWIIGKPPEKGGTEDEYSIYVQKPLSYFPRMRFFGLVTKTIAEAIKAGGTIDLDFSSSGDGNLRQRAYRIMEQSFDDAGSFVTMALQLIAYSPSFMLECYCLWLDVPAAERYWAKEVMQQPHDPDRNKWGLTDEQGLEMIEVFIDQNYEDIRAFFAERLPRIVRRVQQQERARLARASESAPSKP